MAVIVAVYLNEAGIGVALAHLAGHAIFDQGPDVLHLPDCHTRAKLHWLGVTAQLDAKPPGALADGQRPLWCEDRRKTDKTCPRKINLIGHNAAPCKMLGAVLSDPRRYVTDFGWSKTDFGLRATISVRDYPDFMGDV